MTFLSAALALVLVAAAGPSRPCTPAKANERVHVSFLADSDLGSLAKWAQEATCVEYGFDPALANRRLAQAVILTVSGRDVGAIFEILLHTMNVRSYARGSKRYIVADGPETAQSRDANDRDRTDSERERVLGNLDGEIKRRDETHYTITRKGADAVIAGLPTIARSVRVSPELKGGKQVGFRLTSLKSGALFARVGLQSGDVITSLNGTALTSPDRAVDAYSKFRTTGLLRATYLRRGKERSVEIQVE